MTFEEGPACVVAEMNCDVCGSTSRFVISPKKVSDGVTEYLHKQRVREVIDKYCCCDGMVLDLGPSELNRFMQELGL